jgi:hypothetical protein
MHWAVSIDGRSMIRRRHSRRSGLRSWATREHPPGKWSGKPDVPQCRIDRVNARIPLVAMNKTVAIHPNPPGPDAGIFFIGYCLLIG